MLADEPFALHFLEDTFASGHVSGTSGDASKRKGTHDFYGQSGLEVFTRARGSGLRAMPACEWMPAECCLWPIPDKASAEFMIRFYDEWKEGLSPSKALSETKRWASKQGLPQHMIDAFVFFGI